MIVRPMHISLAGLMFVVLAQAAILPAADTPNADGVAGGCCRSSGDDIKQHLKTADRLYAQFKPREASTELQKVLQQDPNNTEAILKLSRAHIDLGDMI